MSTPIVLATLNARYTHASFGLRCLRANLGEMRDDSVIVEGIIKELPLDFVTRLLAYRPKVVGLGVYIWNARPMLDVVRLLRQVAPNVIVVVGGPEVSHEIDAQEICSLAHHVVTQEGEVAFASLCRHYLSPVAAASSTGGLRVVGQPNANAFGAGQAIGGQAPPHVVTGGAPPIEALKLAYEEYTDADLRDRIIYVEASRGCPFRCAFCLSALDKKVRPVEEEAFFAALERLYERGLRQFKFVDRTFNLDLAFATRILRFFGAKLESAFGDGGEGFFLHFEMVPDRLPPALIDELAAFPPASVQLEVGLQTFNADVAKILERRTDFDKACANIQTLRERTGVHIHADLIAGLPGEGWESFGRGFDRLVEAGPHEIQLGILKRLRGFPLASKEEECGLVFDSAPPYEILRTPQMPFEHMVRMRQVAKVWDLAFNQGRFPRVSTRLMSTWNASLGSVFDGVCALTDAVIARHQSTFGLALIDLAQVLFEELLRLDVDKTLATTEMEADFTEGGKRRPPPFLARLDAKAPRRQSGRSEETETPGVAAAIPARQRRHASALPTK